MNLYWPITALLSTKMAAAMCGRVLCLILFIKISYAQMPDVKIQAFRPKGLRISVQDVPKMTLFAFHGNLNHKLDSTSVGTLSAEVLDPVNGRWVYEEPDLKLKVKDVVYYNAVFSINKKIYEKTNQQFTVTELEDPNASTDSQKPECKPTKTRVRGGKACAGETIFEEQFDSLDENVWQIEQYIPIYHPEYPFVSYQRNNLTVSTAGGNLHINAKLQQHMPGFLDDSIYSGTLNLFSGCTSSAEACIKQASGADILPPIVSGRITSIGFAFTYGTVEIRAKLPQGDWLYPEILLEPFLKKYGSMNYASGVVKIACARGNAELYSGPNDYSNTVLYGGPIMDLECRENFLSTKRRRDGTSWGDSFHTYSVQWTPDFIALSVDGEEWARVEAPRDALPAVCAHAPRHLLQAGSQMAPFDDHFYITLGVAAGGITEFRDGSITSGGVTKPWRDSARKASVHFWRHMSDWFPRWSQPTLIVDFVKVIAL